MNVKWQKISKLYQDNKNHYWDYTLEQYEILNNLFKDVKTVKCIGGGPNIDFFIAQSDNDIEKCTNIDISLYFNKGGVSFNNISLHDQYKDYFNYKGAYEFICTDATNLPVFDKPYDCIIDNIGPQFLLDYTLTNPPKIYIINHNKHIENFQWCVDFDKVMPMQFATRESCFYSFEHISPINEHCKIVKRDLNINNRKVPLIINDVS